MSNLTIRPVQFDVDAEALARLYSATSRWHASQWPDDLRLSDLSTLAAELATMDDNDLTCHLVAESQGSVVGLVAGRVVEPPTEGMARYAGRVLQVHDIVVYEASRRQGVGRALLAAIEEWARERGAVTCTLSVHSGNTSAEALYQEAGYRAVDVLMRRDF